MRNVLVAMSGGVDSSVAAGILKQKGYTVTGVTLKLWGGKSDSGCCSIQDTEDARRVANKLEIEHHVFNFGDDFNKHVVDPYIEGHRQGTVPNPCIECNRHIKFDKLFRRADALGFDLVATGHYAQIQKNEDGIAHIARGKDVHKDQSYVINMLQQAQISRLLLPVGSLTKEEVRQAAETMELPVAQKPDSQNVCFIQSKTKNQTPTEGRKVFLEKHIELRPAKLVDKQSGKKVGEVDAIELVSIGQRKGLGLGGAKKKRHITNIDYTKQEITVSNFSEAKTETQKIKNLQWVHEPINETLTIQCSAHGARLPGKIVDDMLRWGKPELQIMQGQSIVFYQKDRIVGSGIAGAPVNSDTADSNSEGQDTTS